MERGARGRAPRGRAAAEDAATLLAELEKSFGGRLRHLPEADRDVLVAVMEASVAKLLHAPTARLKRAASDADSRRGEEMAQVVRELFELPEVGVVPSPGAASTSASSDAPPPKEKQSS